MRWVGTEGGYLVVLSEALLSDWRGVVAGRGQSDYDRACEIDEYLGVIPVGDGAALVLGGEPLDATWVAPDGSAPGMLVRWGAANDEAAVVEALGSLPTDVFEATGVRFLADAPRYYLFDSALPGSEYRVGDWLEFTLPPHWYQVETADYRPDRSTWLVLHRFSPT